MSLKIKWELKIWLWFLHPLYYQAVATMLYKKCKIIHLCCSPCFHILERILNDLSCLYLSRIHTEYVIYINEHTINEDDIKRQKI